MNRKKVKCVITTKKVSDFDYILSEVKKNSDYPIDKLMPVFLNLNDFLIEKDPDFNAHQIFGSWWALDKLPILIIDNINDLNKLPEGQDIVMKNIALLIN